jgi:hypothetical protein
VANKHYRLFDAFFLSVSNVYLYWGCILIKCAADEGALLLILSDDGLKELVIDVF